MSDVVLIFPPYSLEERYGVKSSGENLPPLGLAYLAAMVKDKYKTLIIDAPALNYTTKDVIELIKKENPKIIGITALTPTIYRSLELAKEIKKIFPEKPVVLGGPHVTAFPEETLKEKYVDAVILGEGEYSFLELVDKVMNGKNLNGIKGIFFKRNGKIIKNKPREPLMDLDKLPFPARDLLPLEMYKPLANQYKKLPLVHMITSRGCCWGKCTYCYESIRSVVYRRRSPENVINEIKHVVEKYGAKEISFWDDTFVVHKDWIMKFCDLIKKEKLNIIWSCVCRVNFMTEEILKAMKDAGCWNIFYGIESGSQELLNLIKKGLSLPLIKKVVKQTKDIGIEVRGSFMIGLPGETPELGKKTIEFAKELEPDYAQFSVTTPYPGTELYEQAKKYGTLSKDWSRYNIFWRPVFVPKGYKDEKEVAQMAKRAFREFYFRPRYVINTLKKIRSFSDLKRIYEGIKVVLGMS